MILVTSLCWRLFPLCFSQTHLVSNIRRQHRCNHINAENICKSSESAVSCFPARNQNEKDLTISNPQFVTKRMIDFYDQTLDFLLIMQSMLKDFKPSNSGLEVFNRSRITKWLKIAVFVLKIAIQLKWWSKTWIKTWIKNWTRSRNEDQKIIIQRVV